MEPDELDALREVVQRSPHAWAGMLAVLATVFAVAWLGAWLAMTVTAWPFRRSASGSWTERARSYWPSRRAGAMALVMLCLPAMLAFLPSPFKIPLLPSAVQMALACGVAFWGALEANLRREFRINPAYAFTRSPLRRPGFPGSCIWDRSSSVLSS